MGYGSKDGDGVSAQQYSVTVFYAKETWEEEKEENEDEDEDVHQNQNQYQNQAENYKDGTTTSNMQQQPLVTNYNSINFPCPVCRICFETPQECDIHFEEVHTFQCGICLANFSDEHLLDLVSLSLSLSLSFSLSLSLTCYS